MAAMRQDPVFVLMTSRSGSSMVAGVFAAHGLWTGPTRARLYETHENHDIIKPLRALIHTEGAWTVPPQCNASREAVLGVLERAPPDRRWMIKAGIDLWHVLDGVFDDARFVFVKRNPESVAKSLVDKRGGNPEDVELVRRVTEARYAWMDATAAERGIPYVLTDEVMAGNYSSFEAAFRHCDMEFDPTIARRVIDPARWHFCA